MENSIKAYQGRSFSVTLQSMIGSTNYGWCLTSLPSCFVLKGQVNKPTVKGIGPVDQVFYFMTVGVPESGNTASLSFGMFNLSQVSYPFKAEKTVDVQIEIIPCNAAGDIAAGSSFVKYSENAAFYSDLSHEILATLECGCATGDDDCTCLKYGFPISAHKYGYPVVFKYGYPMGGDCCDDDCCASVKYGFPDKK